MYWLSDRLEQNTEETILKTYPATLKESLEEQAHFTSIYSFTLISCSSGYIQVFMLDLILKTCDGTAGFYTKTCLFVSS